MAKILQGKVVSNKMERTAVVEVSRLVPHPLYKKLLKRSKKYKVETNGEKLTIGQIVKIAETKPVSKLKYFALYSGNQKAAEQSEKTKPVKAKKGKKA